MEKITPQGRARYGKRYWCIKTACSEDGEIYVHGERLEVTPTGGLIVWGNEDSSSEQVNLILAPGQYTVAFAASAMDGSAVAVDYWKGEVIPLKDR